MYHLMRNSWRQYFSNDVIDVTNTWKSFWCHLQKSLCKHKTIYLEYVLKFLLFVWNLDIFFLFGVTIKIQGIPVIELYFNSTILVFQLAKHLSSPNIMRMPMKWHFPTSYPLNDCTDRKVKHTRLHPVSRFMVHNLAPPVALFWSHFQRWIFFSLNMIILGKNGSTLRSFPRWPK